MTTTKKADIAQIKYNGKSGTVAETAFGITKTGETFDVEAGSIRTFLDSGNFDLVEKKKK